jgi:hypothetical protein
MTPAIADPLSVQHHRANRHVIGSFVAPGTRAGALEGFMVTELSRGGMSLLRVAPKPGLAEADKSDLDYRYAWLAVPLPEWSRHLCALVEVIYRRRFGPLEQLGVHFQQMSASDRELLERYLATREYLSFGAGAVDESRVRRPSLGRDADPQ